MRKPVMVKKRKATSPAVAQTGSLPVALRQERRLLVGFAPVGTTAVQVARKKRWFIPCAQALGLPVPANRLAHCPPSGAPTFSRPGSQQVKLFSTK